MTEGRPTASVYVDGFNLYRRALQGRQNVKWLDLHRLFSELMPEHDVVRIHYCTALLRHGLTADVRAPVRQQVYLRALRTDPRISVHLGKFRNDRRDMPVHPQQVDLETRKFVTASVRKIEEKGSDVNLASRMVAGALLGHSDIQVAVTNDSDLVGPLRMLKEELGFSTGIIFPMTRARSSKELVQTDPDFMTNITDEALRASQFPDTMRDANGVIRRPEKWSWKSEGPSSLGPSNR